jgi:ABC-type uncharacterized transport system YnjBCD ATPase subunit
MNNPPHVNLCDNCQLLYEAGFTVKKGQTVTNFVCSGCGKRMSVGKKCQLTPKRKDENHAGR